MAKSAKTAQSAKLTKTIKVVYHRKEGYACTDIYFQHQGLLSNSYQEVIPEYILETVNHYLGHPLQSPEADSQALGPAEQELLQELQQQWPDSIICLNPYTLALTLDISESEVEQCIPRIGQIIEQVYGLHCQLSIEQPTPQV